MTVLPGLDTERVVQRRYDERDVLLYALACGARSLDHVYENAAGFRVPATFVATWVFPAVYDLGFPAGYDAARALHASQAIRLLRPVPRAGDAELHLRVGDVLDKGSAALVHLDVDVAVDGDPLGTLRLVRYLPGAGGWGGPRGAARRGIVEPSRSLDIDLEIPMREDQALLYRLTGDFNPIHVDPVSARAAGLHGPIVHGLGVLGAATVALTERAEVEVLGVEADFTAPVCPGEMLQLQAWREPGQVVGRLQGPGGRTVVDALRWEVAA